VWAVASGCLAFFPDDPGRHAGDGGRRIHLLIALIAFLAVAAGRLLCGSALRSGLL